MSPITTERGAGDLTRGTLSPIASALGRAAAAITGGDAPDVAFEAPRNLDFGDFASNVALQLAKRARRPPQVLAEALVQALLSEDSEVRGLLASASAAAGFINIRLAPAFWQGIVATILHEGDAYGRGAATGERISLEFGSANPTGPLVVVQGRTLSLGASIASALRFRGVTVETEWIINDQGSQIETLGRSLYARYRQFTDPAFPFPEDGYPGDYLLPLARELRERDGTRFEDEPEAMWLPFFGQFGRDRIVAGQQRTAARFNVTYDRWQSEKALHDAGGVDAGIAAMRERGVVYDDDGAVWLRATEFGDTKDRVVVRSDGRPTYYGADIAYHFDKLRRNDRAILILGPDHHGYIARLASIADVLGRPGAIDVMLAQQMTLLREGETVSLSKRQGNILELDEILDEVGVDAARFFFVLSNADSPMTFDLSLATKQSNDNPVFYVQYGHARIASLERQPAAAALLQRLEDGYVALDRLVEPAALALARRLSEFPGTVENVARHLAPARLARYARDVAADFHQFYHTCRIFTDDADLSTARLGLAIATKRVLGQSLAILGVSAPSEMARLETTTLEAAVTDI